MAQANKEKAIENYMKLLQISREEAEELLDFDDGKEENEEVEKLTEKAKANHRYEKSDKQRVKTTKERKVDEVKKTLLEILMKSMTDSGITIGTVKNEAEFSFDYDNYGYTVKLVKHRPEK